mmetsp:Transcript_100730/g.282275  ORF Transcript_100730/g.282275 Transcript_100730/m.282275 type:complete len:276 (-) Transcript_100730:348-1175(-)
MATRPEPSNTPWREESLQGRASDTVQSQARRRRQSKSRPPALYEAAAPCTPPRSASAGYRALKRGVRRRGSPPPSVTLCTALPSLRPRGAHAAQACILDRLLPFNMRLLTALGDAAGEEEAEARRPHKGQRHDDQQRRVHRDDDIDEGVGVADHEQRPRLPEEHEEEGQRDEDGHGDVLLGDAEHRDEEGVHRGCDDPADEDRSNNEAVAGPPQAGEHYHGHRRDEDGPGDDAHDLEVHVVGQQVAAEAPDASGEKGDDDEEDVVRRVHGLAVRE